MNKIGILGAAGQVGAEVTLLLHDREVVPICRNKSGSAFLRYSGVRCRHGSVTNAEQGPKLIGDCSLVANFALGSGPPRRAREANIAIIKASIRCSPAGARIIYFSTHSVYRHRPGSSGLRLLDAYAREKLFCEHLVRSIGTRAGKEVFILRLGHVAGALQGISAEIGGAIAAGAVPMPAGGRHVSNVVHTVTIAEAIGNIAAGREKPGTYDLHNIPQWTWREVYEHEAQTHGLQLITEEVETPVQRTSIEQAMRTLLPINTSVGYAREAARIALAYLPDHIGDRAQALHYQRMARAQLAPLSPVRPLPEAMLWQAVGGNYLNSLSPTRELLEASEPAQIAASRDESRRFPDDLPLFAG